MYPKDQVIRQYKVSGMDQEQIVLEADLQTQRHPK